MSFNNHDSQDPNGKKFGKINPIKKDINYDDKGIIIKIYTSAHTMPLSDFIKFIENKYVITFKQLDYETNKL